MIITESSDISLNNSVSSFILLSSSSLSEYGAPQSGHCLSLIPPASIAALAFFTKFSLDCPKAVIAF